MDTPRTVAILLFDEVEVLDFCGPFEVFSVAGQIEPGAFRVVTVSAEGQEISARNGLRVLPDHSLNDCPPAELLLIPGGMGTRQEMHNHETIEWIRNRADSAELVLSVCTGALLLAKAGLLNGLEATTHHRAIDLTPGNSARNKSRHGQAFRGQRHGRYLSGCGSWYRHVTVCCCAPVG